MHKKIIFGVVLIIALISFTSAISYNAEIYNEKVLVSIDFEKVNNLMFELPSDFRVFESNIEDYKISDNTLKVGYAKDLKISYITNSLIDLSPRKNYFIFNNKFDGEVDFNLYLPAGAILGDLMVPDPDLMFTDGKRIILQWNNFSEEEIVLDYSSTKESSSLGYFLFGAILVVLVYYFYISKKFKKQVKKLKQKNKKSRKKIKEEKKKDFTRNLFGEEKKIMEYLLEKKGNSCWTKEIVNDLEISKVRLSRKLRNLEQKELIEKIPYGNENRIKLLR